jgi:diguanylate cyclase (GGDEF)-like protein
MSRRRVLSWLGSVLAVWLLLWTSAAAAVAGVAVLDTRQTEVDVWPLVSVVQEAHPVWTLSEALEHQAEARPPTVPTSNFGEFPGVAWLFWSVEVAPEAAGDWLLDIGYASLDHVDLQVLRVGEPTVVVRNGDWVRLSERPLPTRTHVMPLRLAPGRYTLVLRVETSGSMIVPLRLAAPQQRQFREERIQMLQGLAAGVVLSLLAYSLAQWYSLRDRMFAYYGLGVGGVGVFQFAFQGMGMQHVWGEHLWVSVLLPPVCILLGILGTFLFIDRALDIRSLSPRLSKGMRLGALVCAATLGLLLVGAISYRDGQQAAKVLGQLPTVLALPIAWRRWREGDRAAGYILVGWSVYTAGVVGLALLISGRIPATLVTLHVFQVASLTEMVMWLVVVGIRVDDLRRAAERDRHDGERLRRLADTDALTGALNRRGLQAAALPMLQRARAHSLVGVYLLDLDGFKPINDRYGHAVGDAVLIEVCVRLGAQVRQTDRVARLGGDEFVVLVSELRDEAAARRIGEKLLQALQSPVAVEALQCCIGATIGYALAPGDGRDFDRLLTLADQAMYAGKQAGKQQIRRATAS